MLWGENITPLLIIKRFKELTPDYEKNLMIKKPRNDD
jgi:hypothetical protein